MGLESKIDLSIVIGKISRRIVYKYFVYCTQLSLVPLPVLKRITTDKRRKHESMTMQNIPNLSTLPILEKCSPIQNTTLHALHKPMRQMTAIMERFRGRWTRRRAYESDSGSQ